MGLLDDAIREHLELKRKHGANPEDVARQEQEALGPGQRNEFAQPEAAARGARAASRGRRPRPPSRAAAPRARAGRRAARGRAGHPEEPPAPEAPGYDEDPWLDEEPRRGPRRGGAAAAPTERATGGGGRARGDARLPPGDARARPPVVRAEAAARFRLGQVAPASDLVRPADTGVPHPPSEASDAFDGEARTPNAPDRASPRPPRQRLGGVRCGAASSALTDVSDAPLASSPSPPSRSFFVTRSQGEPAADTLRALRRRLEPRRRPRRGAARPTGRRRRPRSWRPRGAGLDGATVRATLGAVSEQDDAATATLAVAWEIPRIGRWSYRTRVAAQRGEDGWSCAGARPALHPALRASTRLGTASKAPARGRIDDRRGRALAAERAVVAIDVETEGPRRRRHGAAARRTARRQGGLARAGDRAGRQGRFVPVITLRKADYDNVAEELDEVPGVSIAPGTAPLAPTKDFARALLGAVGPATAEQVEKSEGRLATGDTGRPVGPAGGVRQAAGRNGEPLGRPPRHRGRRRGEDAEALARPAPAEPRDDARPRRPARRRAGAGHRPRGRPRSSRCSRRPGTSWPSPTARRTRRSIAR